MKLYIANCLKQNQIIYFRPDLDDNTGSGTNKFRPAKQTPVIAPGRQIQVGGDMTEAQINAIVRQLEKVGLFHADDVKKGNLPRAKIPYIYSIDIAVKEDTIRRALDHNNGTLTREGQQRREQAAISANVTLQNAAANEGIEPRGFEAAIEQLDDSAEGGSRTDEGFKVTEDIGKVPDRVRAQRAKK